MSYGDMCQLLLRRGADVNSRDLQGRTPLMLCCEAGSTHTAQLLLRAGAEISLLDSMGHDALHYSKARGTSHMQKILQGTSQVKSDVHQELITKQIKGNSNESQSKNTNCIAKKRKAPAPPTASKQPPMPLTQDSKEKKSERGREKSRVKPERKSKEPKPSTHKAGTPVLQVETVALKKQLNSNNQEPITSTAQEQCVPDSVGQDLAVISEGRDEGIKLEESVIVTTEENISISEKQSLHTIHKESNRSHQNIVKNVSQKENIHFHEEQEAAEEDDQQMKGANSEQIDPPDKEDGSVSDPEINKTLHDKKQGKDLLEDESVPCSEEQKLQVTYETDEYKDDKTILQDPCAEQNASLAQEDIISDHSELTEILNFQTNIAPDADSLQEHYITLEPDSCQDQMHFQQDVTELSEDDTAIQTDYENGSVQEIGNLKKEMQKLRAENQELQDKIQILENYERDESDMESSADFIPLILYDSLQSQYMLLQEQLKETQNELHLLQSSTEQLSSPSCKLIPFEAYEQLQIEQEALKQSFKKQENTKDLEHFENEEELQNMVEANMLLQSEKRCNELEEKLKKLQDYKSQCKDMQKDLKKLQESEERCKQLQEEVQILCENKKQYKQNDEVLEKLLEKEEQCRTLQEEVRGLKEQIEMGILSTEDANKGIVKGDENQKYKECRDIAEDQEQQKELLEILFQRDQQIQQLKEEFEDAVGLVQSEKKRRETLEALCKQREDELKKLREDRQVEENKEMQYLCEQKDILQKEAQELRDQLEKSKTQNAGKGSLHQTQELLEQTQEHLSNALQELKTLRENAVPIQVHRQEQESLTCEMQDLKIKVRQLEQKLQSRERETEKLQHELDAVQAADQTTEALKNEVTSLTQKLSELSKRHERTSVEVFQVQREALFMKSEKQAAEEQLEKVQKQLEIVTGQMQHIQEKGHVMSELPGEKEQRISELSQEVLVLKESLNRQGEQTSLEHELKRLRDQRKGEQQDQHRMQKEITSLQHKLNTMEQKHKESEVYHKSVIDTYRTHLLCAVQGQMNEDALRILQQILKMRLDQ
ncbi:uveal autoantigen with coiled-coil domains and ankyrin repeats isoform X2 [Xenopus laevis]|nr:uveal autoantigen with coiled-coil domains and ankyrin repeats isoform X2 [Xenopus laevis]OCU00343.1 hypothetical protein XELAEV_18006114mg [Xenopus laevis]